MSSPADEAIFPSEAGAPEDDELTAPSTARSPQWLESYFDLEPVREVGAAHAGEDEDREPVTDVEGPGASVLAAFQGASSPRAEPPSHLAPPPHRPDVAWAHIDTTVPATTAPSVPLDVGRRSSLVLVAGGLAVFVLAGAMVALRSRALAPQGGASATRKADTASLAATRAAVEIAFLPPVVGELPSDTERIQAHLTPPSPEASASPGSRRERGRHGARKLAATSQRRGRHGVVARPTAQARAEEAREAYEQANASLFSGDTDGAIRAYERAIARNPKDPAGYRGLGLSYAQRGHRAKAIRYLRRYLAMAPAATDRALVARRIALLSGRVL